MQRFMKELPHRRRWNSRRYSKHNPESQHQRVISVLVATGAIGSADSLGISKMTTWASLELPLPTSGVKCNDLMMV